MHESEHDRLGELAAAIADGRVLDWDAVESRARDEDERASIRRLRDIAAIGLAHSELMLSGSLSESLSVRTLLQGVEDTSTPATWGSLRILERVGRGRFGDVYRAWDRTLDREVALKLLRRRDTDGPADHEVIEEGRLMARVRHPNVVTIHGAQRVDGRTGLWMEFVDGRTLEAELNERGPFETAEVVRVGIELCRALQAVHDAGLIHRDVKLQNVLRDRSGRVLLGDFGTGHPLDTGGTAYPLAGTPAYIAPEVLNGGSATPQGDVYSLGVLLFRLATNRFPVTGRSLSEIRGAHDRQDRVALTSARHDLPLSLSSAIERALSPDVSARFSSAADFAAALDQTFRSDSSVSLSRYRGAAAVALASGVGVIAVAAFITRSWDGAGATERRSPESQYVAQPDVAANAGTALNEVRQAPGEGASGATSGPLREPLSNHAGITTPDRAPRPVVPPLGSAQDYSAAAETFLRNGDVAEARRYAVAMARRFADDPLYGGPWWRLTFEARAAWLELDARAALEAARALAAVGSDNKPAGVGMMLPPLFVALGQLRQAEQIASELPPAATGFLGLVGSREFALASILSHFQDSMPLRQFLANTPLSLLSMNQRIELLIRAGLVGEAEELLAKIRGGNITPMGLERAAVAVARDRPREALDLLGDLSDPKGILTFRVARVRALAWDALGDSQQAIVALTNVDVPRFVVSGSTAVGSWLEHRALLARLLRKAGRFEEARETEDELRRLLAVADDDHPIVRQLRNVE